MFYFRAGYTPNDYPSSKEWDARLMIERSLAIKCPNIGYHLAGTKKMQQVFAEPGVLERYFPAKEDCATLRMCFTDIHSLEGPDADANIKKAISDYHNYLMKPQREGGGNLIYGEHMKQILENISDIDRKQYILMKRIHPPAPVAAILRNGQVSEGTAISEFGVFCLFLGDGSDSGCVVNQSGGYLLRTKFEHVEDGGVASGVAVMSSVYLE